MDLGPQGPDALPPMVSREAYRIVQEGLSNALRHAGPDAAVALRIALDGTDLEILAENPLPAARRRVPPRRRPRPARHHRPRPAPGRHGRGRTERRHLAPVRTTPPEGPARPRPEGIRMTETAAGPIRIVLADDERMVRTALRVILSAEDGLEVVGEAATGAEAVSVVRELTPDVVLMDVRMPEIDGIRATEQILRTQPEPPRIVVVTTFENDAYVYEALRAGASGFLLKRADADSLVQAVRLVARSDSLLFPAAVRALAAEYGPRRARGPGLGGQAHRAGERGAASHGRGAHQRGDRRTDGCGPGDGEDPRGCGACQDGGAGPHAGGDRGVRGGLHEGRLTRRVTHTRSMRNL